MIKRPMLAAAATSEDLERLAYPLLGSPKLDGIRVFIHHELGPVTRKLKPVPNEHIRKVLSDPQYHGIDGEIMLAGEGFNSIQSAVMSHSGTPNFEVWAFDYIAHVEALDTAFEFRLMHLSLEFPHSNIIKPLKHTIIPDAEAASDYASECIANGFEGAVFRDPQGAYKQGRSTLKQQGMIKYKEFKDAEGIVVGFEELQHNANPEERDELGYAKHSDKKEGMVAADTLGALVLNTSWGTLRVGTGFDFALRDKIWRNPNEYLNRQVTFKYQTHGMQDLPRFPVFLRFRDD